MSDLNYAVAKATKETNKLTNLDVEFRGCGVVNKLPSTDMWTANALDAWIGIKIDFINLHTYMENRTRKLFYSIARTAFVRTLSSVRMRFHFPIFGARFWLS